MIAGPLKALRGKRSDTRGRMAAATVAILAARRVLPTWEAWYPTDTRPRRAIEAAEAAVANPSRRAMQAAARAARASDMAAGSRPRSRAKAAAEAAAEAALSVCASSDPLCAVWSTAAAWRAAGYSATERDQQLADIARLALPPAEVAS